jgi:hypothetical protein
MFVVYCAVTVLGALLVPTLVSAAAAQTVVEQGVKEEALPNPGRPTVATPAGLTPVGYVQFENGIVAASHSGEFSSRYGFNEVIKLAVTPRLEVVAVSEPIVRSRAAGRTAHDTADLFFGGQAVIRRGEGASPTISAAYFQHIYGGEAPDFDIGTPANSLVLLASANVKGFHYDLNGMFNRVTESSKPKAQFGQALAVSRTLGKFTISGEVWHFSQPFMRSHAVGNLWGVAYAWGKNVMIDAAINRGLTRTSTRWETLVGFTYLMPVRLWSK